MLVSTLLARIARPPVATGVVRALHASAPLLVRKKQLKKLNRLHKHWAKQMLKPEPAYVDPVLGRPDVPFIERLKHELGLDGRQVDALHARETALLADGAEEAFRAQSAGAGAADGGDGAEADEGLESRLAAHQTAARARQREAVRRILALPNASAAQSRAQAVQFAVAEFRRFEGDTGSPEVQAAVATIRILAMAAHAKEAKQDVQTKRALEHAVQKRRGILMYLRRANPERYVWTIEKLGLHDASVCAEFHMSRKYLFKVQFYGDRTLPLKKTRRDAERDRALAERHRRAERYLAEHDPQVFLQRAAQLNVKKQ